MSGFIELRGARTHNLKDLSLDIPLGQFSVITGPSGSGKSSLAYDTIFAEAQRRFSENISPTARQYFSLLPRADFDTLVGLSPAIALRQGYGSVGARSTLGTLSEIHHFLRVLYAKLALPHCNDCNTLVRSMSPSQMCDHLLEWPVDTRVDLLAARGGVNANTLQEIIEQLRRQGVVRVIVGEEELRIDQEVELKLSGQHELYVVVDRLKIKPDSRPRIMDSVESTLRMSNNVLHVLRHLDSGATTRVSLHETFSCERCGISLPPVTPRLFSFNDPTGACPTCDGLGKYNGDVCESCSGLRLGRVSRMFQVQNLGITDALSLPLSELRERLRTMYFVGESAKIAQPLVSQMIQRIDLLLEAGLHYLSLGRAATSLSRGELQRVRICTQLSSQLSGVLYVLDEPSAGLHPYDCQRLIRLLRNLVDSGNTILAVEHETSVIASADYLIEIGPSAGEQGGELIESGPLADVLARSSSEYLDFLKGKKHVFYPAQGRDLHSKHISLKGLSINNIKDKTFNFPLNCLTAITGISGSGKSSLLRLGLLAALKSHVNNEEHNDAVWTQFEGYEGIENVIEVVSEPISQSPRSNPSTYLGIFSKIRELFAMSAEAKVRGYEAARFSFNVKGGRCETCRGAGVVRIEMQFLSDTFVQCEQCSGRRYNADTLAVKYRGLTIAETLEMTAVDAAKFFHNVPKVSYKLRTLVEVGLGYLRLGQPTPTLSGGESQRLRLAKALGTKRSGNSIFVLDEPTSGLHLSDLDHLSRLLHRLVDQGNTVILATHSLEFVRCADWVMELGPGPGDEGGNLVFEGTPGQLSKIESHSARFLKS